MGRFATALIGLLALTGCAVPASPTPAPAPTTVTTDASGLAALQVGDCTEAIDASDAITVAPADCTADHFWEVSAVVPLPDADYPGEVAVRQRAQTECAKGFRSYVGLPAGYSPYQATFLGPSQDHWANPDAHRIACLAGSAGGGLSTSIKGRAVAFPEVGQCAGAVGSSSFTVPVADCAKPHYYEVYAAKKLTGTRPPTSTEADQLYAQTCTAGFSKFVGIDAGRSTYEIEYFIVPDALWSVIPDHRLVCAAGSPSGRITGSLKGVKK